MIPATSECRNSQLNGAYILVGVIICTGHFLTFQLLNFRSLRPNLLFDLKKKIYGAILLMLEK